MYRYIGPVKQRLTSPRIAIYLLNLSPLLSVSVITPVMYAPRGASYIRNLRRTMFQYGFAFIFGGRIVSMGFAAEILADENDSGVPL